MTPLQMLIAEKIIESNLHTEFDLLVIVMNDNDKHKYYYNRLKRICFNTLYYTMEAGLSAFLKSKLQLKKNYLDKDYQELYLASIENRDFRYIISKNRYSKIFTFDDGIGNIVPSSELYLKSKPNLLKIAIFKAFGIKYYKEDIRRLSLLHYTIYENIPNIVNNTQLIKLYKDDVLYSTKPTKILKIYLGQPLFDLSSQFHNNYVVKTIESLKIYFYYPHPREKELPSGDFDIIESSLVFEDYIVDYLRNNLDVQVDVYSFLSGTLLNIANLKRVSVKYIYNDYLFDNYKEFYNFAEKNFGIKCLAVSD